MVTVPNLVDETPLDQYTATASQTDFNFTYMIFATADIKVYVNGVLKTETTDYVVKQSDGSAIVPADDLPMDGGKVVFNSGLTLNDEVSLSRDIAIERLTGYSVAGAFRADVVNAEFTKIYAVQQQLERDLARTVQLSASDAEGGSLTLPSSRASKFLYFDASGDLTAAAGTTEVAVSAFMETVLDDTTAAAARTTLDAEQIINSLTAITTLQDADQISVADNSDSDNSKKITVANLETHLKTALSVIPVGAVFPYAVNSAPSGFLECDGSAISRTTYADLFSAIGTTFGVGDGSTTFNIPDLRGEFIRGWDNGKGTDSGRSFGSSQTDEFESHTHTIDLKDGSSGSGTVAGYPESTLQFWGNATDGATGSSGGASETRPRNIALMYCIKY